MKKSEDEEPPKENESGEPIVPDLANPLDEEEDVPTPTTAELPDDETPDQQTQAEETVTSIANIASPQQQSKQLHESAVVVANGKLSKTRNLHKTASVFFRGLPPTITRSELEEVSYCPFYKYHLLLKHS